MTYTIPVKLDGETIGHGVVYIDGTMDIRIEDKVIQHLVESQSLTFWTINVEKLA